MSTLFAPFIRIGAFARKEIVEIFRQPRLLLTLILGPFLILLLFGIGYRNEGRNLRALVVANRENPVHKTIREYAQNLGPQLTFVGISENLAEAKTKLRDREVDLVVVVPDQPLQALRSSQQSVITVLHNEVDPYQADYVAFTGQLYTEKLNRWLLGSTLEKKKAEVGLIQKDLADAINAIQAIHVALDHRDIPQAKEDQKKLNESVSRIESKIEQQIRSDTNLSAADVEEIRQRRQAIQQNVSTLADLPEDKPDYLTEQRNAAEIEKDLVYIQARLIEFRKIDSRVLVSPFTSKAATIAKSKPQLSQFFIPSVIVLLLQHLAITFASLSVVREFRSGAAELFKISPLRPLELILGKYFGYFIVGAVVASALTAALLIGLRMPMLGDIRYLVVVLSVLLFASMSIGFTFSLLATTEIQAIQYTMIFLLVSIFFSGFLLNLHLLWEPIRLISWILPATYGIRLAQDVILRGEVPDLLLLALLATLGAYFFVISYRILRNRLANAT
jgi:ABC-2 type transport system permease protein